MESFKNCSLVGLVLLLAVSASLAMPKWVQVEEDEAMMKENYGDFTDVRTARNKFKEKMTFKLNDPGKRSADCTSVKNCGSSCPTNLKICQKCCGKN